MDNGHHWIMGSEASAIPFSAAVSGTKELILPAGSILNQAARDPVVPKLAPFLSLRLSRELRLPAGSILNQAARDPGWDDPVLRPRMGPVSSETSAITFSAAVSGTNLTCRVHFEPGCPRPRMG